MKTSSDNIMFRTVLIFVILVNGLFTGCASIKMQQSDLLPGERVIGSKPANAIIVVNDYGLSSFAFDQLMWVVGMNGKEAIGGHIHLTNYRLFFKSHSFNRVTGKFSIFLPTILQVNDISSLISKKIEVVTETQLFDFVIWDIPEFVTSITSARGNLTAEEIHSLRSIAASNYNKCGEGLQVNAAFESANLVLLNAEKIADFAPLATDRIQASSVMNLWELFSK